MDPVSKRAVVTVMFLKEIVQKDSRPKDRSVNPLIMGRMELTLCFLVRTESIIGTSHIPDLIQLIAVTDIHRIRVLRDIDSPTFLL